MKKLIVLLLFCLILAGCSTQKEPTGTSLSIPTTAPTTSTPFVMPSGPITFFVYTPNEAYDGFTACEVTISELNAHDVLATLFAGEVLLDDVAVNYARINGNCLELDMNQAFYTQLTSMGTTGEKMLVGSLVNTFLSAYGTETVMLTVDRQIIDSGHIVYGEPLGYFE